MDGSPRDPEPLPPHSAPVPLKVAAVPPHVRTCHCKLWLVLLHAAQDLCNLSPVRLHVHPEPPHVHT